MNNPSQSPAAHPAQTLDLSAGLGYGLIYQPVIGLSTSPDFPFAKQFFYSHRRNLHRRMSKMRK